MAKNSEVFETVEETTFTKALFFAILRKQSVLINILIEMTILIHEEFSPGILS